MLGALNVQVLSTLIFLQYCKKKKKKKIKKWANLKSLRKPAFWAFKTCCFKFIKQKVERTQKSTKNKLREKKICWSWLPLIFQFAQLFSLLS